MRPNALREKFNAGQPAYGGWIQTPTGPNAELMSQAGYDFVCIDMQHGMTGYSQLVPVLQGISNGTATATVRVPWNEPGIIGKALDAGAMAIIIPMVNTPAECEDAVARCSYPPLGRRSYGPVRALYLEGADYLEHANDSVVCIPMIETAEAVANIDDILSVPGVDAIYVGPSDLAISMGFGPGCTEPAFHDALATIVEACNRHGVVPGIHASAQLAADRVERGFRMVTITADFVAIRERIAADLALVRGEEGGGGASSLY